MSTPNSAMRSFFVIIALKVMLSGCSSSPNNFVELPDETPLGEDSSEPCSEDKDCDEYELCAPSNQCTSVWEMEFTIGVSQISIPETKGNGEQWDKDGSPPDPNCIFFDQGGGSANGRTETVRDSFVAKFEDWEIVNIAQDSILRFECFDNLDEDDPESIGRGCWGEPCSSIPFGVFRNGVGAIVLQGGGADAAQIEVEIKPYIRM